MDFCSNEDRTGKATTDWVGGGRGVCAISGYVGDEISCKFFCNRIKYVLPVLIGKYSNTVSVQLKAVKGGIPIGGRLALTNDIIDIPITRNRSQKKEKKKKSTEKNRERVELSKYTSK